MATDFLSFKNMKAVALISILSLLISSCGMVGDWSGERVNGTGELVTQTRDIGSFNAVSLSGIGDLYLHQGAAQPIEITTEQNIHDILESRIENGTLKIGTKKGYYIGKTQKLEIHVWSPEYSMVESSGAADIRATDRITADHFEIGLSGAGSFDGEVEVSTLKTQISGAGEAQLGGSAEEHEFHISGAGSVEAYDLRTNRSVAHISGAGDAQLHAESHLEAHVSGAGSIRYKGSPEIEKHVSGVGTINAAK